VGGVALYFAILIGLIICKTVDINKQRRDLWLSLGLVPIIRITSIVMPLVEISVIYWYIITSIPILLAIYNVAQNLHFTTKDVGLTIRHPLVQFFTAIAGIGLGVIDYYIIKPGPIFEGSFVQLIFPVFVLLFFNGLVEEMAFRGIMQRVSDALGAWGWTFIAPVYAILQFSHGSILHILFTFVVALYFGFIVKKTNSIMGVSLAHGLMSIILFLVFPNIPYIVRL